jgi:hypothetical protein
MLVGLLVIVYGAHAWTPLVAVVAELVAPAAVAIATLGVAWCATLAVHGRAGDLALAAAGACAYVVVVRAFLPGHWELVRRLLSPLTTLRVSARQPSPSS